MNKNTLTALLILGVSFWFFNSRMYYDMLGKPFPADVRKEMAKDSLAIDTTKTISKADTLSNSSNAVILPADSTTAKDSIVDTLPAVPKIEYKTFILENSNLKITISEKGGKIVSALTKNYTYEEKFKNGGDLFELLTENDKGIAGTDIGQIVNDSTLFRIAPISNSEKVQLIATINGENIIKTFSLKDSAYTVDLSIKSELLNKNSITLNMNSGINESETENNVGAKYSARAFTLFANKKLDKNTLKKTKKEIEVGDFDWVGLTTKYFAIAVLPEVVKSTEVTYKSNKIVASEKDSPENFNYEFSLKRDGSSSNENFKIYLGPTKISELKKLDAGLDKLVFRGYGWFFFANIWFPKVCSFVLWVMNGLYAVFGDYGIAILFLTLLLKLVTFPLSQSSMKSMAKMKEFQPKIKKIQDKYKSNPTVMQQELMAFYKKEGVNPLASMGGCLPMFLQMPIMISLFIVLRKAVELRGETTFLLPWVDNLAQAEVLFKLPFTIPMYGSNFALLPLLYAILMFFQNKMTMKDPNQKAMVWMMPIIMLVMFNNFPAGLTLYFALSSLFQIGQQMLVDRGAKKKSKLVVVK